MIRTFVDSGVLIAAARGAGDSTSRALEILSNPERTFVSSPFIRLEVLPKAQYHKREQEVVFYEIFFRAVETWVAADELFTEQALSVGARFGLSALDALHMAAALQAGVDEVITSEKPGRPIHRITQVAVRTIHS